MTRAEEAKLHIEDPNAIEHADAPAKGVIVFIACLIGSILLILLIVWGLFAAFRSMRTEALPFPTPKASMVPPEPRIQYAPRLDLQTLRAQEDAILHTYGWVDRSGGVVRLPIDRAMDLIAQRGLPARTGTGPVPTVPSTGPESGGPQTGQPVPRGKPAQPAAATESSVPLRGPAPPMGAPGPAAAPRPGPGQSPGRNAPGVQPRGPASRMPQGGGSRSTGPSQSRLRHVPTPFTVAHAAACRGELQFAVRRAEARRCTLERAPCWRFGAPQSFMTSGAET